MTKDELNELLMGVALVALGYALIQHFKTATAAQATQAAQAPAVPPAQVAGGAAFAYGAPSPFTTLTDLLSGSVHDIGGAPTSDGTSDGPNFLAQLEASNSPLGDGPRVAGAYW